MASPPSRNPRPQRPGAEPPPLLERLGCFLFVAMPLLFGLPVARAWATVLGSWVFYAYLVGILGLLLFTFYLLEKK